MGRKRERTRAAVVLCRPPVRGVVQSFAAGVLPGQRLLLTSKKTSIFLKWAFRSRPWLLLYALLACQVCMRYARGPSARA